MSTYNYMVKHLKSLKKILFWQPSWMSSLILIRKHKLKTFESIGNKIVMQHSIFIHFMDKPYSRPYVFYHFRHLGRHLEFLKMLNDDRLSSSRILSGNVLPIRIHQEKNFIHDFQVHRKYATFVPD